MPSTSTSTFDDAASGKAARTIVLLCTYNEVGNLPELFEQLSVHLPDADILVVDDNSPDGTSEWVRQHPQYEYDGTLEHPRRNSSIFLLHRSEKLGLGSATRAGLQWCLEHGYDLVVNLDADLSHPPRFAPDLVAACLQANPTCDVAVGSRYVRGGSLDGLSLGRRMLSRLLNTYVTWLLRLPVKDCSGSYRCYRVASLRRLDLSKLTCPGYGFLEELLVALHRCGARLVEVPIQFQVRGSGQSKLGMSDAWGALRVVHRLAINRRLSYCRDE